MDFFSLEHSQAAYTADFAAYGVVIAGTALALLVAAPPEQGWLLLACAVLGLGSWSGVEYLLHRYVLHGVQPFCHWHALHHARPMALIGSPTLLSASLFAVLVFGPVWAVANAWVAGALTMGMMAGYLAFGLTHHAMHHSRSRNPWLARRKRWHALHHHRPAEHASCYGVTSNFWDHVFGTTQARTAGL
jgi:cyclopropane-fatty-acyl-phospholipid synthase